MISEEDANQLNLLYYYNYKLVEHLLRNAGAGCSNHPSGTKLLWVPDSFFKDLLPDLVDFLQVRCIAEENILQRPRQQSPLP
jgi:hypothetical protein